MTNLYMHPDGDKLLLADATSLATSEDCCCPPETCQPPWVCDFESPSDLSLCCIHIGCYKVSGVPVFFNTNEEHPSSGTCTCDGGTFDITGTVGQLGDSIFDFQGCGAYYFSCFDGEGQVLYRLSIECNEDDDIVLHFTVFKLPYYAAILYYFEATWEVVVGPELERGVDYVAELISSSDWPCGSPPEEVTIRFSVDECDTDCAHRSYITADRDTPCDPWDVTLHSPVECTCEYELITYFPSENPTLLCFSITCEDESQSEYCVGVPEVVCDCTGLTECEDMPDSDATLSGFVNFDEILHDGGLDVDFTRHWVVENLNNSYTLPWNSGLLWVLEIGTFTDYGDAGILVFWDEYDAPNDDILREGYLYRLFENLLCSSGKVTIGGYNFYIQVFEGLHSGGTPTVSTSYAEEPVDVTTVLEGQVGNCFTSITVASFQYDTLISNATGAHSFIAVATVGGILL